jgi:uncharacterized protein YndB with AHSA1/START domain
MAKIEGEILIRRPIGEVFDYVADTRNEPRYNRRMRTAEKVTAGPIGPGTGFVATFATRRGSIGMTTEITAIERPTRLASSTRVATVDINGELTFAEVPGGTRMRWSWDVDTERWSKLLAPVVARLGARQERRIWTGLKRVLEGQARPLAAPGPGVRPGRFTWRGSRGVTLRHAPGLRVRRNDSPWVPRWIRAAAQRCSHCLPRTKKVTR